MPPPDRKAAATRPTPPSWKNPAQAPPNRSVAYYVPALLASMSRHQGVTRNHRAVDGTRLEFRMNNKYQPGGARFALGGPSTVTVPAPRALTTSSSPRCDMLKPCV